MSDDTTLPPPPVPIPALEPTALKSILNPVQSGAATPSSVIVEPPRSPQRPPQDIVPSIPPTPVNGSTDDPMEGVAVPSAPQAEAGSSAGEQSLPPLPIDAPVPPSPLAADEPPPTLPADAIPPAVSTPTVITQEADATPLGGTPQPPVVPDATPPPPPPAAESAPVDPIQPPTTETPAPVESTHALIPPTAEPSPISTPAPVSEASAPAANDAELAAPASSGLAEPAPTPVESTPATTLPTEPQPQSLPLPPASGLAEPVSEPMQVDEPVPSPSSNGLKRSGEDLEGGDEKRVKEESATAGSTVPTATPQATETAPALTQELAPPAPAPAPATADASLASTSASATAPVAGTVPLEMPPEPQPEGPTTPLTSAERTHLTKTIQTMKKNNDGAIFAHPVDPVLFQIPHYPQYITKPMDLGTVELKLYVSDPRGPPKDKSKSNKWDESMGKYSNVAEVVLDVRQIWWNTARFNGKDHVVTQAANRLATTFNKALKALPVEVSDFACVELL